MAELRTSTVTIGETPLQVYVAETSDDWRQGLVGRNLNAIDGMLFRFASDTQFSFQMAGMSTPVLVAFYAATGALVDLTYLGLQAQPYRPTGRYRYALELVGQHPAGALDILPDLYAGLTVP